MLGFFSLILGNVLFFSLGCLEDFICSFFIIVIFFWVRRVGFFYFYGIFRREGG